jgi:hypothetical protein
MQSKYCNSSAYVSTCIHKLKPGSEHCKRVDLQHRHAGAGFSIAYDGSALDTVAKVKQAVMLSGGVLTALASSPTFQNLNCTTYDVEASDGVEQDWHAVFCYGWADAANNTGEGWWLCKNRCDAAGPQPPCWCSVEQAAA